MSCGPKCRIIQILRPATHACEVSYNWPLNNRSLSCIGSLICLFSPSVLEKILEMCKNLKKLTDEQNRLKISIKMKTSYMHNIYRYLSILPFTMLKYEQIYYKNLKFIKANAHRHCRLNMVSRAHM